MRRLGWLVCALGLFWSDTGRASPIVAVFDIQDRGAGLSAETLQRLADYLVARLAEGGYTVVPRDQLRKRMKAQRKESYRSCFARSCQIELGRELAAQKTLATTVMKLGTRCHFASVLYDLKRATTDNAATAEVSCEIKGLVKGLDTIATKLGGKLKGAARKPPPSASNGPKVADSKQLPGITIVDGGRRPDRVKLSKTRVRFVTSKGERTFIASLQTADGRTITCNAVRLGAGCSLPRLAAGPATLAIKSRGLTPLVKTISLEDDRETWVYKVLTMPSPGSVIAWTFGGIALAAGAALVPTGLAIDSSGMVIGGAASLIGGAGLLWLGFVFDSWVMIDRDDYDLKEGSRGPAPGSRFVVVPTGRGISVAGQF